MAVVIQFSSSPYPGLRPFRDDESDIFFGRERQTDQLLARLTHNRFLAVIGPSGCGKSSLVRAGMLPALRAGFMAEVGSRWRICELRPGDRPLGRLARALASPDILGAGRDSEESAAFLEATLRRGPLGLIEIVKGAEALRGATLLVLVDQFEEIFRYRERMAADEADAFVALLLASAGQHEVPIYVVITMRADYLGECAVFQGLPEAVSDSQYLTPRLTREELELAITGPARVFGGQVDPQLQNRLINDFGTDPDQLPLLQHAMARLWSRGSASGAAPLLTVKEYEAIGGIAAALSKHGDEVLAALTPEQQRIAAIMFRRLSGSENGRRDVRAPARVEEVAKIAAAEVDEVIAVAEAFRRSDCRFLAAPEGPLRADTLLDVSHESLIRQWQRLAGWVAAEADSTEMYERLGDWAQRWEQGNAELWRGPDLASALAWRQQEQPSPAWAERYGGRDRFQRAIQFLDASAEAEAEAERLRKRAAAKRSKRNRLIIMAFIAAAIGPIVYDLYVNLNSQYFNLNLSENVELYRGKPMSWNFFNIHKYIAETDYGRSQIDPVMMFKEKVIKDQRQPILELLGYLQPLDRIAAYWQHGEPDRAFAIIPKTLDDYPERKQAVIETLGNLRSLETITTLEEYLQNDSDLKDLHEKIVTVMALFPHPRVVDILLAKIQEDRKPPAKVRRAVVEALGRMSLAGLSAGDADRIKAALAQVLRDPAPVERSSEDEEALVRLAAGRTLGLLGDQRALAQLKRLAVGENRFTRRGAVEALGGSNDTDVMTFLLDEVDDKESQSNSFMRRSTVEALGQVGGPGVVEKLIDLIADERVDVRRSAAEALGRTGDPRAVPRLIERLEEREDEPEAQQSLVEALGRLGNSDAIRPLLRHMRLVDDDIALQGRRSPTAPPAAEPGLQVDDDPPLLRMAVEALGRLGTADMSQTLIDQLAKGGDPRRRRVIMNVLGRLGATQAIAPLQAVQHDAHEKPELRQSAAEALARLGEATAVARLIEVLNQEKGRLRVNVASALGRLGHQDALTPLRRVQQGADKQDGAYPAILEALGQLGDASVLDDLTTWLQRGDSRMRQGTLETVVGSSTARMIERWITQQSGEDSAVRQAAVEALGRFESLRPVELLMTRLSDGSVFVRRGAARALGQLGKRDVRVLEPLMANVTDGDSGVRQNAAEALGQLGNLRAVAPLIALLRDSHSDVRREAAAALGKLGDDRALQPLLSRFKGGEDRLRDGVEEVRRAALLAYAKIGLKSIREHTGDEVSAVFKDTSEHGRVRLVAAVALPRLRPSDPLDAQIQTWLEHYASSAQISHRKELAELLGEFPTAEGTLLLFKLLQDDNLSVKASALTALGMAKAQEALPVLHQHLGHPNFRLQKAATEALGDIASAESIASLATIARTNQPTVSIPTRLASLQALHNIAKNSETGAASREQAIAGMLGAIQSETDEAILGIRTYNLLGDLQAHQARDRLHTRLRQEEARQREWRRKRDAMEDKDVTEEQTRQWQGELKEARSRPYLAFDLAYNIARIDQAAGVALLHHDLADLRRGAWVGLGRVGHVALIGQLRRAQQQSEAPLFRHAAYRAIDHMLLRLEAEEIDPQELSQLEALYTGEVGTLCKNPVRVSEEKGLCLRVEWTIAQLKAKSEIHGQQPSKYSSTLMLDSRVLSDE